MKVTVKTSGLITGHLAGSDRTDGVEMPLPDGSTVGGLLARIGLSGDSSYLVIVNGSTVPKDRRNKLILHDGDRISIVPPLKGG